MVEESRSEEVESKVGSSNREREDANLLARRDSVMAGAKKVLNLLVRSNLVISFNLISRVLLKRFKGVK